jgi:hypothetical protein
VAKTGRNDPCPCGSGKKFKRCHGSFAYQDQLNAELPNMLARAQAAQVQRQRQQGMGRPIISAQTEAGLRVVAVNNRLMYSKAWKTFHDFLSAYVKTALGPEWGDAELAKAPEQRHPILNWYQMLCEHQRGYITEPGKVSSAQMTGADAAYMFLAYDLYALDHNAELQKKLLARLRNRDNFEGARYEIFVAAVLIRAGFEIEFENEDDRTTTHCEFTATFTRTGKRFSVEAKHRAGTRLRMGHLLIGALAKQASYPRIVFVDINMPDDGSEANGPALMNSAIRKLRGFEGRIINGQPLPPAYLIVTNTPWHHHLASTSFRCGIDIDGFEIPDFKVDTVAPLRAVIEARERHIELHELIRSIKDHSTIPVTFDGEIPEFSFGDEAQRLLIGRHYLVEDDDGTKRPAKLTTATVMEKEKKVFCGLTFDNGKSIIGTWQLSDQEMAAWRRHPDTFFGEVGQRSATAETPLQLYDFFLNGYKQTPKERLLELMANAPDYEKLAKLDQPALASIFAERTVYGAMAASVKTREAPDP